MAIRPRRIALPPGVKPKRALWSPRTLQGRFLLPEWDRRLLDGTELTEYGSTIKRVHTLQGEAYKFNHAAERLEFANDTLATKWAVVVVGNFTDNSSYNNFIWDCGGSERSLFNFGHAYTNNIAFYDGSSYYTLSSNVAYNGTWHTYVLHLDGSTLSFFVDGQTVSQLTIAKGPRNLAGPFAIGNRSSNLGAPLTSVGLNGSIAYLAIIPDLPVSTAKQLSIDPYAPIRQRQVIVVVPAGLTTVSDSSTYTWNIQQRVADTLIARWDQLQVLSDAAALLWDVRQIANDTVSAIWNDKQLVSDNLTSVWSLAGQVTDSLVAKYDLLQSATDTAIARWNLRQSVADTIVAVWHERGLVSDQLTAPWNVYITVHDVLNVLWNDLSSTTVSDSLTLVWNAAGTAADALTGQWNVLQKTSFWETIRWDVYQQLSGAVTARWSDFANASRSLTALWAVAGVVSKHLTTLWDDLERLGVSRSMLWDIAVLLAKDITANWNVYALLSIGDVLTVKYDIIGKTDTSVTLRWNVYTDSLPANKIIKVVSRDTTVKISFRDTILKVI